MLRNIDSKELSEWMAYYKLDPFGGERGDLQAGIVASTVANVNRDSKKRRKPFEPKDFMVDWAAQNEPKTADISALMAFVKTANAAMGGVDLTDKG